MRRFKEFDTTDIDIKVLDVVFVQTPPFFFGWGDRHRTQPRIGLFYSLTTSVFRFFNVKLGRVEVEEGDEVERCINSYHVNFDGDFLGGSVMG